VRLFWRDVRGRQATETAWCSAGWFRPDARRWVLSLRYSSLVCFLGLFDGVH
jgi:hypothetical protein